MKNMTLLLNAGLYSSSLMLSLAIQAAPDGGLIADNTAGTQVIQQAQTFTIQGGMSTGGHLLHSFQEFNVKTGQTADFHAAPDTQVIISRVTGPNDSWINGTIQSTTSQADMYLINPHGIATGADARLDIGGAFYASTADYVTLADGQQIYADPGQGLTLTTAAPEAFGFADDQVGRIRITGGQLHVSEGEALSLVGGNIDIIESGQEDAPGLKTSGGQITLIAVASAGTVTVSGDQDNTTQPANITITDSFLSVANTQQSATVGQVIMQGNQVTLSGGKVTVGNTSDDVSASGPGVRIQASGITLQNDAVIDADTHGKGSSGPVELRATESITLDSGQIQAASMGAEGGTGPGADLQAVNITLLNARMLAETFGEGQGGSINLKADDIIRIESSELDVTAQGETNDAGSGGDLVIQAREIILAKQADLNASTLGTGDGGYVQLHAGNQVHINQSKITAKTTRVDGPAGGGGYLEIQAREVALANQAEINASTSGTGAGGYVDIDARVLRMAGGARILSGSQSTANNAGIAGELRLEALEMIEMSGASQISTESKNGGGGSIQIATRGRLHLQDSRIITSVKGGQGKGGDILIDSSISPVFIILDNSAIRANAYEGEGGNITLIADYLLRSGPAVIEASSELSTDGEINVQAVTLDGSSLQATDETAPLDVAQWQQVPCHLRQGGVSRLIMAGYDAHPTPVDDVLSALPLRASSQ